MKTPRSPGRAEPGHRVWHTSSRQTFHPFRVPQNYGARSPAHPQISSVFNETCCLLGLMMRSSAVDPEGSPKLQGISRWTRTCWKSRRVSQNATPVQSSLPAAIPSWEAPEPWQFLFCQNHGRRGNSCFCSFVFTWPSLL